MKTERIGCDEDIEKKTCQVWAERGIAAWQVLYGDDSLYTAPCYSTFVQPRGMLFRFLCQIELKYSTCSNSQSFGQL